VLVLTVACASAEPSTLPPPVRAPDPHTVTGPPLPFKHVRFAEGSMEIDLLDVPHHMHAWDVGGVLSQTVTLGDDDTLRILVRAAEGESLDGFRRDHDRDGAKFSRVNYEPICGRRGQRLEIHTPEVFIECIIYTDGHSAPGYIPATTAVAYAFEHGDLDVVVSWEIPTAKRETYREDEQRFFGALRCP
jgi:hypothetical protein